LLEEANTVSNPVVLQPGLVQIKACYSSSTSDFDKPINLLWFVQRAPTTLTVANMTTIANTFDPLWAAMWNIIAPGAASYIGCVATDYSTAFGATWDTRGTYTPNTGTKSVALPNSVSALISLHVAERWRGGHARIYLPYVAEDVLAADANFLTSTQANNVSTKYALIEPGMNGIAIGGGLSQRVYRQRTDAVHAHLMPIQSYTVNTELATQRRRMRKVAHH
jgi:hypothetical protein